MTKTPAEIAAGLTEAQRRYIKAISEAAGPYEPRHGRTANWFLKNGLTDTVVALNDGREGFWDDFAWEERFQRQVKILGQKLTPFGLAVREHLEKK